MLEIGMGRQDDRPAAPHRADGRRRRREGEGERTPHARVAVLPETVLGLELLLQARVLDLRAVSDLLREDPGALLQMYRLLADECPVAELRPARLEECLANVSLARLHRRLRKALAPAGGAESLEQFARHAAEIGRRAEAVGETLGLAREQAWTVGMLHELGEFRSAIGQAGNRAWSCAALAERYCLPVALCEALDEVHREVRGSVWYAVVSAAHELRTVA